MTTGQGWQNSRWRRWQAAAIGRLGYPLVAALSRSLRWRVEGGQHFDALDREGRPYILALWHGRILPAIPFFRGRGVVAITSENFDGEWVARIMARFGYAAARGSTSRGGVRALVQMKRDVASGKPAAFTVDGPRGPACHCQPGVIWLAKATGHPILPFHIEADRAWTTSSWDHGQIPKPFALCTICFAPPLFVAPDVDEAGLERARTTLEATLLGLMARARQLAGTHGGGPRA